MHHICHALSHSLTLAVSHFNWFDEWLPPRRPYVFCKVAAAWARIHTHACCRMLCDDVHTTNSNRDYLSTPPHTHTKHFISFFFYFFAVAILFTTEITIIVYSTSTEEWKKLFRARVYVLTFKLILTLHFVLFILCVPLLCRWLVELVAGCIYAKVQPVCHCVPRRTRMVLFGCWWCNWIVVSSSTRDKIKRARALVRSR